MSVNCSWLGGCKKICVLLANLVLLKCIVLWQMMFLLGKDGTKTLAQSGKTCLVPKLFKFAFVKSKFLALPGWQCCWYLSIKSSATHKHGSDVVLASLLIAWHKTSHTACQCRLHFLATPLSSCRAIAQAVPCRNPPLSLQSQVKFHSSSWQAQNSKHQLWSM